ncbi:MAG: fatty acid desaturase [Chromatiales bacterium]|jgi:fatty acid desaturase
MFAEMADMWQFARKQGFAGDLKNLHHPRLTPVMIAALTDWAIIAVAAAVTIVHGWLWAPLSILVIGNRQRALGNILHDASHNRIDSNRKRAQILTHLLFSWPLWVSMQIYCEEHQHHHRYLADPKRDPDFIHDESRLTGHWLSVWIDQIFSLKMFRTSLLSHLPRMDLRSLLGVLFWWGAVLGLIAFISGTTSAMSFLGLWIVARATAFHVITSFREISDHVGLQPGTLIGFSRNHPVSGGLAQLFHPHNNGYHLLHHLAPGIPYHAFPQAHELLLQWAPYATGEQCHSYFFGDSSAVHSWVKRWH